MPEQKIYKSVGDYPACPDVKYEDVRQLPLGYGITLDSQKKVRVQGQFIGKNTGCAVFVHDMQGQHAIIFKQVHELNKDPESFEFSLGGENITQYLLSVWTFVGDYALNYLPKGWWQVEPTNGMSFDANLGGNAS